ncbi:MAG: RNA polymerase sigma factor RpoD/SigA [Spirochaetales bacterium]|nr:RNA polymerase sigma factor RpoD/SigA [Spirochaetales bacterium]
MICRRGNSPPSAQDNILQLYLDEIGRYPLLNHEEQRRLAEKACAGDLHARHALVRANLRFVVSMARRYRHSGVPLIDLISEGNLGLLKAAEYFDPERGYHFVSYAGWWVRQAILRAISERSRLIRLPWNRAGELLNLERERQELELERSGPAPLADVAKRLNQDASHLLYLLNCARPPLSLDYPAQEGLDAQPLSELVPDRAGACPADVAVASSLRDNVRELLGALSQKEAEILRHRFGLDGRRCLSLQELGRMYCLSKERIRQIEKQALHKLRNPSHRRRLEAYIA